MKKIFFFLISLFLIFSFFLPSFSLAQNKGSSENYQELLQNYRSYQDAISPFNVKKSRHLAYGTIDTQVELLNATKNLTSAEIKAITSYTAFIKSLLAESTQILQYRETFLYIKLDDELAFLNVSSDKVGTLSSLSDAEALTADLSDHYKKISRIGYQTKAIIEIESVKKVFTNLQVEKDKLSNFLDEQKESTSQVLAAKEKFSLLNKDLEKISGLIGKAESSQKNLESGDPVNLTNEIWKNLSEAVLTIKTIIIGYQNIVSTLK